MEKISLICVLYNHSHDIVERMFQSAVECLQYSPHFDYNIMLVDNGEECLDHDRLLSICPSNDIYTYINTGKNLGYCGGNNFGIARTDSDYILVVNPDIIFLESLCFDWIVGNAKLHNAISGKLIGNHRWYTYSASFPLDKKYDPDKLPFYHNEPTLDKPGNWKAFKYIDGSLMCFAKKLWEDVGGFDEEYFPGYFGENAFMFKAFLKDYKIRDAEIHNCYKHSQNHAAAYEQKIINWSKEGRKQFYKNYALQNYDKFLEYMNM